MSDGIFVSVVICTYNREKIIGKAIESVLNQNIDHKKFEVIVVDNNSSDDTANIVRDYDEVRYIFEPKQGISYARNRGYKESKGKYVAYIDDDAKASPNWLDCILNIIEKTKPTPIGLGGPIHPYYISKKPEWFKDEYEIRTWGKKPRFLKNGEIFSGSNMIFEKKMLQEIGGFDTELGVKGNNLDLGEETKLYHQIWERYPNQQILYYSPKLIVYHLAPPEKMTIKYFLQRRYIVGQSSYYNKFENIRYLKRPYTFIIACGYILYNILNALIRIPFYKNYKNWIIEGFGPIVTGFGLLFQAVNISISFRQYKADCQKKK